MVFHCVCQNVTLKKEKDVAFVAVWLSAHARPIIEGVTLPNNGGKRCSRSRLVGKYIVVPLIFLLGLCASVCRRNEGCPTSHDFVRRFVYSDVDFVRQPLRLGDR